jgi:hypothetical protein
MLLVAVAVIWGLLSDPLAWGLVIGYVVLGFLWVIVRTAGEGFAGLLAPGVPLGNPLPDLALLGSQPSGGRLDRLRTRAIRFLASFVEICLWPAAKSSGRSLHTVGTGSARVLHPRLGTYAVLSALLAVTLIGARAWSGPSIAVTVAAVALLMTLTARHLLWIVSGEDFRRLLKRSRPSPYRTLVTLAIFDFIAILAIVIVLRWKAGEAFDSHWAVAEGRDLISLRHLTRLPERADLSPLIVVLAVAVAAFWASVASQLFKVFGFRRDDDDRAWLAALLLSYGYVDEASRLMESVPRQHVSGPVLQVRIRLALVRSEHEEALALSRTLADLRDPEHASAEAAIVYLTMQLATMPALPEGASRILRLGSNAKISDGAMFAVVWLLRSTGLEVEEDWKNKTRASGLTPESYPIAWSWLQRSTAAYEDALRTLEATDPASDTDIAVRELARQAAVYHRGYENDTEQQLADMVRVLSPMGLEQFPWWLRQFLVNTTSRLEQDGRSLGLPGSKDLRCIRRRLLAMPTDAAEAVLEDFDAAKRARLDASWMGFDVLYVDREPW